MKSSSQNFFSCLFSALLAILFIGCEREQMDVEDSGKTKITIRMEAEHASSQNRSNMSDPNGTLHVQNQLLPLTDTYEVVATLKPATVSMDIAKSVRSSTKAATPVRTPIPIGTTYFFAVYTVSGQYVSHQEFTYSANQIPEVSIDPGEYIFVTVASGTNSLPSIDFDQPLAQLNLLVTDANIDLMYHREQMTVQEGVSNNLHVVLRHLFSQVTLTINTAEIGDVVSIGTATITPNFPSVNVSLSDGVLSYPEGATSGSKIFSFATASGSELVSNPVFFFPANSTNGSISIADVQIGGITKPLQFSNLVLNDGVKYNLDLRVLAAGVDIGYEIWSAGNLMYVAAEGRYSFTLSDNDYGDYWFFNHLLPKRLDGTNQGPDPVINGGNGDPCAQVLPTGRWRLPMEDEFNLLLTHTGPDGVDNPHNVNNWDPARYVDYFDGAGTATNLGMFFGTQNNPGTARHNYLFFVFAGAYHNENTPGPTIGHEGNYLLTGNSGGYREFHLTGAPGDVGYGAAVGQADEYSAYQIRCIKN